MLPTFPRAKEEAVKANPGKSDRIIAQELRVGSSTVRRARAATAPCGAVDKRIGKDGKARRLPARRIRGAATFEAEECGDLGDVEKNLSRDDLREAYFMRATDALRFAVYTGPVDEKVISYAREVADAWECLAIKLEKSSL